MLKIIKKRGFRYPGRFKTNLPIHGRLESAGSPEGFGWIVRSGGVNPAAWPAGVMEKGREGSDAFRGLSCQKDEACCGDSRNPVF
jgi:hypothetical protein